MSTYSRIFSKSLHVFRIFNKTQSCKISVQVGQICMQKTACKRPTTSPCKKRFTFWRLLNRCGVTYKTIYNIRRKINKFSHPWFGYCIPVALVMGFGDIIAQKYTISDDKLNKKDTKFDDKSKKKDNKSDDKLKKKDTNYDYRRTLIFMTLGFTIVGPILSQWYILLYRKLKCRRRSVYVATRIVLDQVIVSPLLLAVLIGIYDHKSIINAWPNIKDQWDKKYKKPFWDILKVNLMTRPLMVLTMCYFSPLFLRRYLRALYEILFCAYVSKVFHDNKFGALPPPPDPKNLKKGKNK